MSPTAIADIFGIAATVYGYPALHSPIGQRLQRAREPSAQPPINTALSPSVEDNIPGLRRFPLMAATLYMRLRRPPSYGAYGIAVIGRSGIITALVMDLPREAMHDSLGEDGRIKCLSSSRR